MQPTRMIYEDAPAFIPVPAEFRHHRIEVTLWPLEQSEALATRPRRLAPPNLAGKARDLGNVLDTVSDADWGHSE
jgi:hypothetical protein